MALKISTLQTCRELLEFSISKNIKMAALIETQLELEPELRYLEETQQDLSTQLEELKHLIQNQIESHEDIRIQLGMQA